MFTLRTGSRIALVVLGVALATTAGAANSPKPVGKVSIESTSIAAGIGVSWGDGILRFKGKEYRFSIDGLTLVDIGISKANAVGDVYDLKEVGQFEGTYVAGEAGFALAGGMGGMSLRNQNGVVMHLRSVTQGAKLQLGPAGLTIKLKQ
ncbi:MAG TPA: DUF1134 domain-containing protein [Candidatus Binatia bacterium]|nr:DUF1134 domain-containing protein [Candidatus Binatia bacterium]